MHSFSLLSVVLAVCATFVAADSHTHRANYRGVHRRHHARAQDTAPVSTAARRRCPARSAGASSSASAPSSTIINATSTVVSSESTSSNIVASPTSSTIAPSLSVASSSAESATTSSIHSDNDEPRSSAKFSSSSSSSSFSKPAATPSPQKLATTGSSLLSSLFPISNGVSSWSTHVNDKGRSTALSLSDSAIRATRILSGVSHNYVQWQDKTAMEAHYPRGAYNFQHEPRGGFSLYAYGPKSVDLTTAKEATIAYSVWFEEGFEFNLGGKIPGFWGGDSDEGSISCSGGARSDKCFSSRLMWRTPKDGVAAGELYTYLPPSASENEKLCTVPPFSDCNPTYGASVGRGAFQIRSGRWETLTQRVRLNDVGKANGEIEVWANGKSVISVSGLVIRKSDAGRIRGLMMQTFFGGSKPEWASPKDQRAYFADFSVAIIEKL